MDPDEALLRQIALYREMSGEQRLRIALDLHEFACEISRMGIRRQQPEAGPEDVEQMLRQRIEAGRQ